MNTAALSDVKLQVTGMTCASGVSRVEKALRKVPGVSGATVNLATEKASIQVLSTVPVAALNATIEETGYIAIDVVRGPTPALGSTRLQRELGVEERPLQTEAQRLQQQGRTVSWLVKTDVNQRRQRRQRHGGLRR